MGKLKPEMKRIHRRKKKKARENVKLYIKGEIPLEKLNTRAKILLKKRKRTEKSKS